MKDKQLRFLPFDVEVHIYNSGYQISFHHLNAHLLFANANVKMLSATNIIVHLIDINKARTQKE